MDCVKKTTLVEQEINVKDPNEPEEDAKAFELDKDT